MPRPRTASDESILRALAEVVGRDGPHAVTLARVAAEARLAPATIVQRFGSRHGLLLAFARHGVATARDVFEQARAEHDSPLAALRAALTQQVAAVQNPERLANHLGLLHMDLADPELRALAGQHAHQVRTAIIELLRSAKTEGELVADTPVERVARSVQVAYNGGLITWALSGNESLITELTADITTVLRPFIAKSTEGEGKHDH